MDQPGTLTLFIQELREFASFNAEEQHFIHHSLEIGLAPPSGIRRVLARFGETVADRRQAADYRELRKVRELLPTWSSLSGTEVFMGPLTRISAQDLARGQLTSFSAYRFLYERLLGAKARPWLPAAFCGAAALPQIPPRLRETLLRSLTKAAATSAGWSAEEPRFFPESIAADPAPAEQDEQTTAW